MAISYVGNLTGNSGAFPYWFGNGPISFDPYTPGSGNAIFVVSADLVGTGKTLTASSTVGSYAVVNPPGDTSLNSQTLAIFSSSGVSGSAQTVTANSSPGGDFLNIFGFEFSGVGSVTATITSASSSSTTTGSILGSAVVVPTGSLLFALCFDQTHAIGSPPVIDNGTAAYTNFFDALGVTFAGSGASVTPLFTPGGAAATNYAIVQILLSPPASTLSAGVIDYAISAQNTSLISALPAAAISYGINLQAATLTAVTGGPTLFANALAYDILIAPAVSGSSLSLGALSYTISPQSVLLGPILDTVPNVVGLSIVAASAALVTAGFVASVGSGVFSSTVPLGIIATQSIPGGTLQIPGTAVIIQPSLGPPPIGALTIAQAIQAIIQAGLVPVVLYTPSASVPAGSIIPGSQSPPAGTLVIPGSQQALVSFVVSAGPPQLIGNVTMPNCVGLFVQNAYQALQAVNLSVDRLTWVVSNFQEATVTAQSVPAGNSVQSGTIIKLTVSLGPAAPSKAVATPTVS